MTIHVDTGDAAAVLCLETVVKAEQDCKEGTTSHKIKKQKRRRKKDEQPNNSIEQLVIITPPSSKKKIRIAKRALPPIAKSPMFMTSPSSIYVAVCKYNSMMDALHGGVSWDDEGDDMNYLHNCPRAGDGGGSQLEFILILIHIYFGGCPEFDKVFSTILSTSSICTADNRNNISNLVSPATVVEKALHQSVRHLCSHECFLKAYHPIREFSFLWRDIVIDHSERGNAGVSLKKDELLSGWRCRLHPGRVEEKSHSTSSEGKLTTKRLKRSLPLVYISPDGMEFNTKTKAINYMNSSLSTQNPHSIRPRTNPNASTLMIDRIVTINPLYSPLGLLEELFLHDPWKLLVSTICLNVTTRPQVDKVLHSFLQRWPDCNATAKEIRWEEISNVVAPLGLGIKRAKGLIRFSQEYLALTENHDPFSLTESQVKSLFHIGQYGWTAYELFILKKLPSGSVNVCDHALQLYVEYQLGRCSLDCHKSHL